MPSGIGAGAVDGEFAFDHALAARGYPEGFIGHLRFATVGILDGDQLSHHVTLLANGHIIVGETVQKLTVIVLITKLKEMKYVSYSCSFSVYYLTLLTRTPR